MNTSKVDAEHGSTAENVYELFQEECLKQRGSCIFTLLPNPVIMTDSNFISDVNFLHPGVLDELFDFSLPFFSPV